MNREIKFRGKRIDNDEWIYGGGLQQCEDELGNEIVAIFKGVAKSEKRIKKGFRYTLNYVPVKAETLGQYTGLKDTNGKEIYEGDILRVSEYENILTREFNDDPNRFDVFTLDEIKGDLQKSYTSPVVWEEGTFCFSSNGDWLHHNDTFLAVLFGDMKRSNPIFDFEVIGNIHDNSELLG